MTAVSLRPRVLLAITVYGGRSFVPRTLRSATAIRRDTVELDVLYLDDATPDLEFGHTLGDLAAEAGHGYYRSPHNLGIVRNVNLGLLRALESEYDYVIISNSDVIYPAWLAEQFTRVMESDPTIGSATAWSNNVSIYSLQNDDPDQHLSDQAFIDELNEDLAEEFSTQTIDIPAGISFSMIIRCSALKQIGLMDPIFGRGYCEETDWSRRCIDAGWRLVLAPSVFVYHAGRRSTLEAGLLSSGETTVADNERIIDHRYPHFRNAVAQFIRSGVVQHVHDRGMSALMRGAARRHGLVVEVSNLPRAADEDGPVHAQIKAGEYGLGIELRYRGFHIGVPLESAADAPGLLHRLFSSSTPTTVTLRDTVPSARAVVQVLASNGYGLKDLASYPECV